MKIEESIKVLECHKCKQVRPTADFHKNKFKKYGIEKTCKECYNATKRTPEKRLTDNLRQRERFQKDRKRYNSLLVLEKTLEGKARKTLRNAVSNGYVLKPTICSVCGQKKLLHGHHKDYLKPLEVKWVCALCHSKIHREVK